MRILQISSFISGGELRQSRGHTYNKLHGSSYNMYIHKEQKHSKQTITKNMGKK